MAKLKDLLDKLKGTDNEDLIVQINTAVDGIKAKAIAKSQGEVNKLQTQLNELTASKKESDINKIVKELVGDDEKKAKALRKMVDLDEVEPDKYEEAFKETMEEYSDFFGGEVKPTYDDTIDNNKLKTKQQIINDGGEAKTSETLDTGFSEDM